jgi:hypothetical protein
MAVSNGYPIQNPGTHCAYCGEPFKQRENYRYAWRSSSGKLYCSEFCADVCHSACNFDPLSRGIGVQN